ncbi:MAG: ATP-binding protein [Ardenticatenia bacterium]|nr:ATP-binding protein [Ardenticatenia bacterium]
MPRAFNTAGPCRAEDHYMLPPTARLPQVMGLVEQKHFFVLHAPRQTGKTTALLGLAEELTASGRYVAALLSMEVGAPFGDDPGAAEGAILGSWSRAAGAQLPQELQPPPWPAAEPGDGIGAALAAWAVAAPRPLVVFLDEIDALHDAALISVLRQLRDGYRNRPRAFPWSLALIGLRDVRDYRVAAGEAGRLGTASPFNIKVESITLRNFDAAEVAALYRQHTEDTGQLFTPEALERAFVLTQGQPWLVNALARQAVEVLVTDRAAPVTAEVIEAAKDLLIARQDTHLDSLAERLREERVRRVIEPILAGGAAGQDLPEDDIRYAVDLGLVHWNGGLEIANPIYGEIIPRVLATAARAYLPRLDPLWLRADGRMDAGRLLEAFLQFWRQHGEPLMRGLPYAEVAPHLVLMAFLDRVRNGGGSLEREYAVGSGRMDLCLRYGPDTFAFELKVWREGRPDPVTDGLAQLDRYLLGLGLGTGWLVIFDRRTGQPPIEDRTSAVEAMTPAGRTVTVVRA